ncbi:MAG: ATP-dependent DNA helicase [Treponema sp.]|nr:ATP-dependent DNA helicase [Treponema sp.]
MGNNDDIENERSPEVELLDCELAASYISKGGALSKISEQFEERPVQIQLIKSITNAFNKNHIGVFEAGTGVGKSYAYLIPSVLWALANHERIVISTGTINLQQQLCEKDIPAVEKILGKKIKFVLMKGRQNYICKRRLMEAASVLDLFEDESEEIKRIADWEENSKTGSKSELTFMPSENAWTKVNSESDACLWKRCPFYNECHVMKVKKEAASSNIIVVNHHLLFADIQSRMTGAGYEDASVLPPYRKIIFDEAHGIENAATSFFSESLNRFKINKLVFQLYRKRKSSEYGHLCNIAVFSKNEEKVNEAYELTNKIRNELLNVEIAAKDLIGQDYTKRLYEASAREFGPFLVSVSNLAQKLGEFTNLVHLIMEGISDEDKDVPSFWETKILLGKLENYLILLKNFTKWDEKRNNVYWIQKKRLPPDMIRQENDSEYVILTETPLDISNLMNQGVFEEMSSVICTSATLRTGQDFRYWCNRTGLSYTDSSRLECKSFDSPFPYNKNMYFLVPDDAPLPDKPEFQQWIEMALPRLISAAQGRSLVLFTSYESLKSAHNAAVHLLKGFSGLIMKQGDDDNAKLLEKFKNDKESVLFATDSFWQGVDIPGESLSQVIIVKLPFTVPNDPVFVARSEAIEKRGGNSFMELSLPEAIIKFRQGIGRLIRRSDDKGVVTVLDRRIYEKRYGMNFLAGLPECKKAYQSLQELTGTINRFIFE